MQVDNWRVSILGGSGVGKTTLATQINDQTLSEGPYRRAIEIDHRLCYLEVIDDFGKDEHVALRDAWPREPHGFIMVYSVTSRSIFDKSEVFRQYIKNVRRDKAVFILVGNKCDATLTREVSVEEGAALARELGCEFIETSAMSADNVEALLLQVVRLLRRTVSTD
ncbi:P-loop containing nucleoside triphosphate hydrolase protein [Crassisporium funariophilum]|nr:P-loop containing nucleoside triphosphate hydrolase protein [Crassisporium funariophilum]